MDFNFVPGEEELHSIHNIINTRTGKDDHRHDLFELHYIELRKFKKTYQEISTALDRWVTFLTRAHELDKRRIPQELSVDPSIVKAIEVVDRMFNEEERDVYEVRMKAIADIESKIASAAENGREKGRVEERNKMVIQAYRTGLSSQEIANMFQMNLGEVKEIVGGEGQ